MLTVPSLSDVGVSVAQKRKKHVNFTSKLSTGRKQFILRINKQTKKVTCIILRMPLQAIHIP